MRHANWRCIKCNNHEFKTDKIATTGTGFSRYLNIQNKKFSTVTCSKCKFTEMYQAPTSALSNIFDFFTG